MAEITQKLKDIRQRAKKDYYFFCKHILGYSKMEQKPHQEMCDFLEPVLTGKHKTEGRRKKLLLEPRGSFKSSVSTVGGSLWALVQNPNLRILVCGETQKNATKFVKEIKSHIEGNEKFRQLFGNWVPEANTWRDNEFIISARNIVKKESTVMAASLEKQSVTGMHFDLIFIDDPVSLNNINSQEQLQKTIDFYKMLLSVLEPDGAVVVVGTRYSAMDLYGWLADEDSPEKGQIDVLCRQAISDDGELLFPEVLTLEYLEEQKKTQGAFMWACQYQNLPVSSETCVFAPETIKFYEKLPEGLIYFITLDPAISTKERSDYSALIVNGVDYHHNWYIKHALQVKVPPSELVSLIFDLAWEVRDQLMCFAMEKFSLEQVIKINLLAEMEKRKWAFPIKELPTDTRVSKENRIRALQPRFQNGQVFIRKDQKHLYHQLLYYPQGVKNDDLVDALKSQLQITFPSPHLVESKKEPDNAHLNVVEREIWDGVRKMGKRMVHRKRSWA